MPHSLRHRWDRRRSAPRICREFKFSLLTSAARLDASLLEGEQVLMQGVIDCCFTGPEGLTVVDFKTDRLRSGEEPGHSGVTVPRSRHIPPR